MLTLADVVTALHGLYPPESAESWDAVGPVCGDPAAEIKLIGFAIDPVQAVIDEALDRGADLLITHHPLFLRGTSSVYAAEPKGALVHRLILGGCGLVVAHTNADIAVNGVSESLALAIGLTDLEPLVPGDNPENGSARIGRLPHPLTLAQFSKRVAAALPTTPAGIRVAGRPDRAIERVAVCGGAGDSYLEAATKSGADAYVTADLRHHYAGEHLAAGGPALLDVGHWASEWPWLPVVARVLIERLNARPGGDTVDSYVSTIVTDPWTLHQMT